MSSIPLDDDDTPRAPARLDADKTAKPLTRLIRQGISPMACIDYGVGATAIEHADGSRTPLAAGEAVLAARRSGIEDAAKICDALQAREEEERDFAGRHFHGLVEQSHHERACLARDLARAIRGLIR